MSQHKKNPVAVMAASGKLNGATAAADGFPVEMTPGERARRLNPATWYELVVKRSRDMVCPKCGFGFMLPVHAFRMVPAMLHPLAVEAPLDIQEYWMCVRCFEALRPEDLRILDLRQSAPDPDGTPAEQSQDTQPAPGPPSSQGRQGRQYLGTSCPVCGIE